MGLLSHYVAYRIGRRREHKKADRRSVEFVPMDSRCENYIYCTERGKCINDGDCEYE